MATGKTIMTGLSAAEKPSSNTTPAKIEAAPPGPDLGLAETLATVESHLKQMSVHDKIELARKVSTELELHTDRFPRPPVLYGHLQGCADELEARSNDAEIGLGHWRMLASFEARQEALLDRALTQTAIYMQHIGRGTNAIVDPAESEKRAAAEAIPAAPAQPAKKLSLDWMTTKMHVVAVSNVNVARRNARAAARAAAAGQCPDL